MSCGILEGTYSTYSCPNQCQALIDSFYESCDGVMTPPGKYFDPAFSIQGKWEDQKQQIKIAVERCGCNGGISLLSELPLIFISFSIFFKIANLTFISLPNIQQ